MEVEDDDYDPIVIKVEAEVTSEYEIEWICTYSAITNNIADLSKNHNYRLVENKIKDEIIEYAVSNGIFMPPHHEFEHEA